MDWAIFERLERIEQELAQISQAQNKILTAIPGAQHRKPTRLRIDTDHIQLLTKQGVLIMSGTVTVTTDHDERVPLIWKDDTGVVSAPSAANTTAVSDTPGICTVDVAADDMSIVVRSVAVGSATVTVTNGTLTDTVAVIVAEPAASSLSIDATDATMIPKGTPA